MSHTTCFIRKNVLYLCKEQNLIPQRYTINLKKQKLCLETEETLI